ncbi:hypothetical protein COCCADRAFT_23771 [Bipolaris zeicola 26-R-13]|uniref:Uncharacterized protein n=1 Tax=Cochliobolus carbonum (strain 26-R-13) TaxID=930089 RepID=W6YYH3_COCC2|nr:uncharacterized protein COCCADRAFT_23771 [Bipolaris zeicola 26-R-13]EUC36496.1 hypothetical protein COCCADRAFT_23771 [Bipolaris zeicola 26-R-13]
MGTHNILTPELISHHSSHIFIISLLNKFTNTGLDAMPKPFTISSDSNPPPYEQPKIERVSLTSTPQYTKASVMTMWPSHDLPKEGTKGNRFNREVQRFSVRLDLCLKLLAFVITLVALILSHRPRNTSMAECSTSSTASIHELREHYLNMQGIYNEPLELNNYVRATRDIVEKDHLEIERIDKRLDDFTTFRSHGVLDHPLSAWIYMSNQPTSSEEGPKLTRSYFS